MMPVTAAPRGAAAQHGLDSPPVARGDGSLRVGDVIGPVVAFFRIPRGRHHHSQRRLDTGNAHRFGGDTHCRGQRMRAFLPTAPDAGEEPVRVAMAAPVAAQAFDHLWSDGHLAVFASFAIDHTHDTAGRIDVLRSQSDGFADSQATVINQSQDGLEAVRAHRAENPAHFVTREHDGQRLIPPDFELLPELPVTLKIVAEKHPQSDHGLVESRGTQLLRVAQINKMIEHHPFRDLLEGTFRMTRCQLAHLTQILLFAASPQRFRIDEDDVVLIDFRCVIHRGSRLTPLPVSLPSCVPLNPNCTPTGAPLRTRRPSGFVQQSAPANGAPRRSLCWVGSAAASNFLRQPHQTKGASSHA